LREWDYFSFDSGLDALPEIVQCFSDQAEHGYLLVIQVYIFLSPGADGPVEPVREPEKQERG